MCDEWCLFFFSFSLYFGVESLQPLSHYFVVAFWFDPPKLMFL